MKRRYPRAERDPIEGPMPYGVGEVTSEPEETDGERPAVAQLWLPDPGEQRGWSLYHVWRAEQHQYGLRSGRGR